VTCRWNPETLCNLSPKMTEPAPLQQIDRTYVRYAGRKLSYFAGCDYFRLSSHPAVKQALVAGLKKYGLSVAASRLTTGNHILFSKIEDKLSQFFGSPAALLVSNGYATNSVAAQALRHEFSTVIIDARAHVSLRDASRFFSGPILDFKHRDPQDLARVITGLPRDSKPIVLTDGMFSHDGEIAPLREYIKILPANAMILLDDAHAAGVLGKTGKGTPEYAGVSRDRIVQTTTLSKAFGVFGGAILCNRALREKMISSSPMVAGSTPVPLPLVNAGLKAVEVLKRDLALRRRLNQKVDYVKTFLRGKGVEVPATPSPVIAVLPESASQAEAIKQRMLASKIFPPFIRYPGGPESGYFRIVVSSEHSKGQLDDLLQALTGKQ
jgi:8-amino-7-oxononanoate synthase